MKILQINGVYKRGSTGKITYDIHRALQEHGEESIVCYARGAKSNENNVFKTSCLPLTKINALKARITGLQYNGSFMATNKLISIIKKVKPDVVHLHCLNGYTVNIYRLLDYLKKKDINTVLTLHAEFMYTGGCAHSIDCTKWMDKTGCKTCPNLWESTRSYFFDRTHTAWEMMKKAFDGFDNLIVVSVSPWLMDRAKHSVILSNKRHCTVLNGIDIVDVFHPRDFQYLKKKYSLQEEKILLHVTASFTDEIKGGKYIIELARRFNNLKIIVIGNTNKNVDLPSNIIDVGVIIDQKELAAYYSMADLTVLTSKRETFSMICAESFACGTPVVGFKAGAPEQISIPKYSEFVESEDIDALENVIRNWIDKKENIENMIVKKAREYYSKEKMCNQYIQLYDSFFINK